MQLRALQNSSLPHGALVRDRVVPNHTSLASWYRAHTNGWLVRVHPGVSRLAITPVTPLLRVEAAVAAAMPGSMAAGLTAAWLWGAESAWTDTIELLAPPLRHPGRLDGVVYHRSASTSAPEAHHVAGIRTCCPLRATLDVAAWHPERLECVMDELLLLGHFDVDLLGEVLWRERRRGRPGVRALEMALRRRPSGRTPRPTPGPLVTS